MTNLNLLILAGHQTHHVVHLKMSMQMLILILIKMCCLANKYLVQNYLSFGSSHISSLLSSALIFHALVDLKSARGTQALYVMISRAVSLKNLAVTRWFSSMNVNRCLSQAYRNEFDRLHNLDEEIFASNLVRCVHHSCLNEEIRKRGQVCPEGLNIH